MEAGGPTPHGVGGLKFNADVAHAVHLCLTPHGVGGLKFEKWDGKMPLVVVPPLTGWVD